MLNRHNVHTVQQKHTVQTASKAIVLCTRNINDVTEENVTDLISTPAVFITFYSCAHRRSRGGLRHVSGTSETSGDYRRDRGNNLKSR